MLFKSCCIFLLCTSIIIGVNITQNNIELKSIHDNNFYMGFFDSSNALIFGKDIEDIRIEGTFDTYSNNNPQSSKRNFIGVDVGLREQLSNQEIIVYGIGFAHIDTDTFSGNRHGINFGFEHFFSNYFSVGMKTNYYEYSASFDNTSILDYKENSLDTNLILRLYF